MGSYEYETQHTQRTNPTGKSNHVATDVAESEEAKKLKTQFKDELSKLQELFVDWTEADLLFALKEASGDLELTATRISEGYTPQWGEVKSKSRKPKKEHNNKVKESGQQSGSSQRGHQRGGYSDRGRPRGGGHRGGSRARGQRRENGSGHYRPPRQQHNGPNFSNSDDTINGAQPKLGTENSSNNDSVGGDLNGNSNESWSDPKASAWNLDNTISDWSAENPQSSSWPNDDKVNWDNSTSTDKGPNNWSNDVPTDNSQTLRSVDNRTTENSTENVKDNRAIENAIDNLGVSRESDKSTDNTKHVRESIIAKENINTWDTGTSKDSWNAENNWTSDIPQENWGNDNWNSDASKSGKNAKDTQRSPNPNASRSITAATKSPVSHKSRTIPSQPKASWAQIVKPELKPEPKPEPVSSPVHKGSSEIVKSVSPQISKSPSIPVQTSPTPKAPEPISMPLPEAMTNAGEEVKESIKEISSPEEPSSTPVVSSPVVNVSPRTKEISPPGLLHKSKTGAPSRRLKQDAPVVMPSTGAGLERVGVQFGSLSISSTEEVTELEVPVSPQAQKAEERSSIADESPQMLSSQTTPIQPQQQLQQIASQPSPLQQQASQQQIPQNSQQSSHSSQPIQSSSSQQQQQQQQQQQLQQQLQQQSQTTQQSSNISSLPQTTNSVNRSISSTSTQSTQNSSSLQSSSAVNNASTTTPLTTATAPTPTPQNFNPTYFNNKQQQDQSSATYINQQPHLGLSEPLNVNAPYGSYLPSQPPSQLSGFGIGPIQSLPEYGALYGPEAAQRMMGYYATDPSYGQASPVTTTGYQNRDNSKYAPDSTNSSSSQTSNQQTTGTQQQSTNQQGQNPQQQQAYPLGVPYYPYYYMNQFPSYQQSGYGQPFKSMYPMYNHPHSSKPGSASGYDELSASQIHHLPGVPGVHEYPKGYGGGMPQLNFLGNTSGSTPQPTSGTSGSTTTGGKAANSSNSELNSPAQYKGYNEKATTNTQQSGQSGTQQHQHQQPSNPNYYGQQAQQMFNSYQYPQAHHQYHPHQAHHQASGRNQQQYWSSQS